MYPGINSIGAFREHSYASICSLNFPEKESMFTVSLVANIIVNELPIKPVVIENFQKFVVELYKIFKYSIY